MRCLWLTRIDPCFEDSGELIYSARMIRAFADSGADILALCLAQPGSGNPDRRIDAGIEWRTVPVPTRPAWHSVLSPLPNLAFRCAVPAFRQKLATALADEAWDAIVIDSLAAGWALPVIDRHATRKPRLVYISHNHEETTRKSVATQISGNPLRRIALQADAQKAARLERRLVEKADLVTAISPLDRELYARARARRAVIELTPGYGGRRLAARTITAETPRRVVMVGSFEWGAKQANLDAFVRAVAPVFARAKIELEVVGKGGRFIEALKAEFADIHFTGRVDDVYRHLDQARIAVVPERLGGGFKLKALDYVFNRLPIAALENAFTGMPLVARESFLSYRSLSDLADGLANSIDDLALLNRLQKSAFDSCANGFDWRTRGAALYDAMESL